MSDANTNPWRWSLRMLLALTALTAFGCAAMVCANDRWLIAVATVSLLVFLSAAVVAIIDRGSQQAFAIGFLICGVLHFAAFRWVDELPTRRLLETALYSVGRKQVAIGATVQNAGANAPPIASPGSLTYGDVGPAVSALQSALNAWSPSSTPLKVDGEFGYQTRQAVAKLQNSIGVPANGVMTLEAWRAMGSVGAIELERHGVSGFLKASLHEPFIAIGQWLCTLLFGLFGGLLAATIHAHRRREAR